MARIGGGRLALGIEHGEHELARGRSEPWRELQAARDRARGHVGVAGIPDQPGVVDVLARDVEPENGAGDLAPGIEDAFQLFAAHRLAAQHTGRIGDHDLHGVDIGVFGEKGLELRLAGELRIGAHVHDGLPTSRRQECRCLSKVSACAVVVTGEHSIML